MRYRGLRLCESKLRLVALVLPIVLFACSKIAADPNIYAEFKSYRVAISENQRSSLDYFSKDFVIELLNGLMYLEDAPLLPKLESTRYVYLYGQDVDIVHEFEVQRLDSNSFDLTIYYSSPEKEGLRRLGLTYVFEGDRYVISGFDYYLDSYGEIPDKIVDDFTKWVVPTESEVLMLEEKEFVQEN